MAEQRPRCCSTPSTSRPRACLSAACSACRCSSTSHTAAPVVMSLAMKRPILAALVALNVAPVSKVTPCGSPPQDSYATCRRPRPYSPISSNAACAAHAAARVHQRLPGSARTPAVFQHAPPRRRRRRRSSARRRLICWPTHRCWASTSPARPAASSCIEGKARRICLNAKASMAGSRNPCRAAGRHITKVPARRGTAAVACQVGSAAADLMRACRPRPTRAAAAPTSQPRLRRPRQPLRRRRLPPQPPPAQKPFLARDPGHQRILVTTPSNKHIFLWPSLPRAAMALAQPAASVRRHAPRRKPCPGCQALR